MKKQIPGNSPSPIHRAFFWFILTTISIVLPEVIVANDPIPWWPPVKFTLMHAVYGLYILVLAGLMYRFRFAGLVMLMAYGGLFGLYEGYLIKQLWHAPTWGLERTLSIGGVRVVHTLMLVFFVHSVLAFILPLVLSELFFTRAGALGRAFPSLRSRRGAVTLVIGLAIWLGLCLAGGHPATPVILVTVIAGLGTIWRWGLRGQRFSIEELLPHGWGLWVLVGLLAVEYAVLTPMFRPEALPTNWLHHLPVLLLYVFFISLIVLWRPTAAQTEPHAALPSGRRAAPWWLAGVGMGLFLCLAYLAPIPPGFIIVFSSVGGAVVNLLFLVVCLGLGVRRWIARR